MTKALIIGGGSIANRHGKVLAEQGVAVSFVSQRNDLEGQVFASVSEALAAESFDYVVVANETSKHEAALEALKGFTGKILIEKPLAIAAETLSHFSPEKVTVAFNLRFHPVLLWLKNQIAGQQVLSVECYVGQDLATWRPARPVAEQYSAHKSQGGGALRDLSHELDFLSWLFGDWVQVAALGGRIGQVTVDSDDSWAIIAEFARAKQVSIQLNYLDKKTKRMVIVNTATESFTVDLINFTVATSTTSETLAGSGADTYVAMHAAVLAGETSALCTGEQALATDRLIESIEKAAAERVWVSR